MLKKYFLPALASLALTANFALAQTNPDAATTDTPFAPEISMLFGSKLLSGLNQFSGQVQMQIEQSDQMQSVTGTVAYDAGKSMFQANLDQMTGPGTPTPEMKAQVRLLGLDGLTIISRPDTKVKYQFYPGLKAYLEQPWAGDPPIPADLKIETLPQDPEKVGDLDCLKNIVKFSSKSGSFAELYTIWSAVSLKNFPIKIQYLHGPVVVTLDFINVKLGKPDPAVFNLPPGAKLYPDQRSLLLDAVTAAQKALTSAPAATTSSTSPPTPTTSNPAPAAASGTVPAPASHTIPSSP